KGNDVKPINFYTDQGLNLVSSYKGTKGTWNYFTGLSSTDSIKIREDDVEEAVKTVMRRLEIFWTMIAISIFFFSLYMFVQTKNSIFLIVIILSALLGIYIEKIRRSIKNKQNKMRGE
ncbi:MAG: hypothetical protein Q4G11_06530, partial [Gallicola sp.]|nr:hypothetical protein [Gallicola sp.]